MRDLGRESHYSFDRPARIPGRVMVQSYKGVRQVLEDSITFKSFWSEGFGYVMGDGGTRFMLSGDSTFFAQQRNIMKESLYREKWHR